MTNNEIKDLNEAPASVTLSVVTPKGFPGLFTVRDTSGLELLIKLDSIENKLIEKGYKPQIKTAFGQKKEVEYVEGKTCLLDGGKLKVVHSKDGKTYWSCDNGKYDYQTKTSSGCKGFWTPENYEKAKLAKTEENQDPDWING